LWCCDKANKRIIPNFGKRENKPQNRKTGEPQNIKLHVLISNGPRIRLFPNRAFLDFAVLNFAVLLFCGLFDYLLIFGMTHIYLQQSSGMPGYVGCAFVFA
jgi:hypothetical protein